MKKIIIILLILVGINTRGICQGGVRDMHPHSQIFAMDFSTGNQVPATVDQAILFKGAFIDLVSNTAILRQISPRQVPGQKTFVITQMEPQANGNSFQLVLENSFQNQTTTICTFVYSVDQNALLYLNPQTQNYEAVEVEGYNLNNLNNCSANGNFNPPQANAVITSNETLDNQPMDTDVAVQVMPPEMPDYEQPVCPIDGYQWQPGFWAYSRDINGYYWVPGSWVAPPQSGLVWTPPYWGFEGNVYRFHAGYWGNNVGYYGGVNYGYGYQGSGYVGGEWHDGHYRYNTAVVRVNVSIVNRYEDKTVVYRGPENHAAFNGRGGVVYRPNEHEIEAEHERHYFATQEQNRNQRMARDDKSQFAANNGGKPANVAVARVPPPVAIQVDRKPGNFGGRGPVNINRPGGERNPGGQQPGGNRYQGSPINNDRLNNGQSPQSIGIKMTPAQQGGGTDKTTPTTVPANSRPQNNDNPALNNQTNQPNGNQNPRQNNAEPGAINNNRSFKNDPNQSNGNQNRHQNNGNNNEPGATNNNTGLKNDPNEPNGNQNLGTQPGGGNKNIPVNLGQKPEANNPAQGTNNQTPGVNKPAPAGQPPVNGQKPNNPKPVVPKRGTPKPIVPKPVPPPVDEKKQQ